jgi:hypothetical protein
MGEREEEMDGRVMELLRHLYLFHTVHEKMKAENAPKDALKKHKKFLDKRWAEVKQLRLHPRDFHEAMNKVYAGTIFDDVCIAAMTSCKVRLNFMLKYYKKHGPDSTPNVVCPHAKSHEACGFMCPHRKELTPEEIDDIRESMAEMEEDPEAWWPDDE